MTASLKICRRADLPCELRVARCKRVPELGPKILFFSGGSALKDLCRRLKLYTHNSIHLITPFDAGGSSAKLREAFGMLSVGDLRNRLMALADESIRGNPEIYRLFSHRFDKDGDNTALAAELETMVAGVHPLVAAVPEPLQRIVRTHLRLFSEARPRDFDFRNGSIGNFMLVGAYLNNERDIDSVVFLFSQLVNVRGIVRPVAEGDFHLGAILEDGTRILGQQRLTGKEQAPIGSPVVDVFLMRSLEDARPVSVPAEDKVLRLIRDADLICYPMGSFFSSLLANLLPVGVGRAIAQAGCPKIFIPNTFPDPEQRGIDVAAAAGLIVQALRRDAGPDTPGRQLLQAVLLDKSQAGLRSKLESMDLDVAELDLLTEASAPAVDPEILARVLISLA